MISVKCRQNIPHFLTASILFKFSSDIIYITMRFIDTVEFNLFTIFTELCNHHRNVIPGYLYHPKKKPCTYMSNQFPFLCVPLPPSFQSCYCC